MSADAEEQRYQEEVKQVKQWWTDSRWRYTKRPYTAEAIVQKRGTIEPQYPSNLMAKKLWNIVEENFKVSRRNNYDGTRVILTSYTEQAGFLHIWLLGSGHDHPDGQVPRHCLRFRLAELFNRFFV